MTHSLLMVMARHAAIDAAFLAHQEALLDRAMAAARAALTTWAALLESHMQEEEAHILPLYERRAPRVPGGGVEMFHDEHRKLRQLSAEIAAKVAALGDAPEKRAVIVVLDQETMLKNYLDHHDRRERSLLYPALDRATTEDERVALLRRLGL